MCSLFICLLRLIKLSSYFFALEMPFWIFLARNPFRRFCSSMFVSFQKNCFRNFIARNRSRQSRSSEFVSFPNEKGVQQDDKGDRGVAGGELEDGLRVPLYCILYCIVFGRWSEGPILCCMTQLAKVLFPVWIQEWDFFKIGPASRSTSTDYSTQWLLLLP